MKHACLFAAIAGVALLGFAAPASATHSDGITECGETIETDNATVSLPGDVTCPAGSVGVTITADNVTLNLGGHTISAEGIGGSGAGVLASCLDETGTTAVPCFGTTVKNGRIVNFYVGVEIRGNGPTSSSELSVRDPAVSKLDISLAQFGIAIRGNHHLVVSNRITFHPDQTPGSGEGVTAFGDDVHIAWNTITGNPQYGLRTDGNTARFARNEVVWTTNSLAFTTGIMATNYTGTVVVARNTITGCGFNGIDLTAANSSSPISSTRVRRNEVTGSIVGIAVRDAEAHIWCNVSNDNASDGIVVSLGGLPGSGGGLVVEKNTPNRNNAYGIAATDATDGGGNTATANGIDCTPNIVCTTPPDPPCPAAGA